MITFGRMSKTHAHKIDILNKTKRFHLSWSSECFYQKTEQKSRKTISKNFGENLNSESRFCSISLEDVGNFNTL